MPTFIALLRGVNVGKGRRVPMAVWRAELGRLGYRGVRTLLNSGNAVFDADQGDTTWHADAIGQALKRALGLDVPVVAKSLPDLAAIVAECPFAHAASEPSRLLVAFTPDAIALAGLAGIATVVTAPEVFVVGRHAAYLHCPDGILKSKAGEALLGKSGRAATTRNWATTLELLALARAARS